MTKSDASGVLSRRQEKQLLKCAADVLHSDHPNPSRQGCPGRKVLQDMAFRRLPLSSVEPLVDHIATCSPCFEQYNQLRTHRRTLRVVTVMTLSTVLVAGIVASAWLFHGGESTIGHNEVQPEHPKPEPELTAQLPPTAGALVDLRYESPTRSERETSGQRVVSGRIPRAVVSLSILLPLGSEEGEYEVEFRANGERQLQVYQGNAQFRDQAEVLHVVADTRQLTPGQYEMRLRRVNSAWQSFFIFLE